MFKGLPPHSAEFLSFIIWNNLMTLCRYFLYESLYSVTKDLHMTVPVFELSDLDISESWYLSCCSLLYGVSECFFTDMYNIKDNILLLRTVTLVFVLMSCPPLILLKNGF